MKKGAFFTRMKSATDSQYNCGDAPPVAIVFDEADELYVRRGSMNLIALRRAMRHRSRLDLPDKREFFGLLLERSPKVTDPLVAIGSATNDVVVRGEGNEDLEAIGIRTTGQFPPIFELDTIDLFSPGPLQRPVDPCWQRAEENLSVVKGLFSLGKPLWGSLLESCSLDTVINFACLKMRDGAQLFNIRDQIDPMYLALASYRLGFDVANPAMAEILTSRNMRYITGVNSERTSLRTMQPSEPILAHCSALETKTPGGRLGMLNGMYQCISKGLINFNIAAETVSALILLFAFDKQMERYPVPLRISKFFLSLFPKDFVDRLESSTHDNAELWQLWSRGLVFFNHFVRLTERPTPETLRRAYNRGAALLAPSGWKGGGDVIIPVDMQQDKMPYILVGVMNRENDELSSRLKDEAGESLTAIRLLYPMPHVAVQETGIEVVESQVQNGDKAFNTRQQAGLPRLLLVAVGMSLDIYPAIGTGIDPENQQMTRGIVDALSQLLRCTSEMSTLEKNSYYEHLSPWAERRIASSSTKQTSDHHPWHLQYAVCRISSDSTEQLCIRGYHIPYLQNCHHLQESFLN